MEEQQQQQNSNSPPGAQPGLKHGNNNGGSKFLSVPGKNSLGNFSLNKKKTQKKFFFKSRTLVS